MKFNELKSIGKKNEHFKHNFTLHVPKSSNIEVKNNITERRKNPQLQRKITIPAHWLALNRKQVKASENGCQHHQQQCNLLYTTLGEMF